MIAAVWIQNAESGGNQRVEHAHLLGAYEVQQPLCFLVGDHELHLDRERSGELEEMVFVQHVVPAEAGHGAKRRSAADAELIGLFEQPLPQQATVVAGVLVNIESAEGSLHDRMPPVRVSLSTN